MRFQPTASCLLVAVFLLALVPGCRSARLKGGWETDPDGRDPCGVVSDPAMLDRPASTPAVATPREIQARARPPVGHAPVPQQSFRGPRAPRPRRGVVNLRKQDLAGVDHWLSARNSQWVIGDVIDVYASKEYFSTMLTLNAKVGMVQRQDRKVGEDHLVVMRFIGNKGSASAMTNPRVQIGPGLTVTARRILRVRMAKTRDQRHPVQFRVMATGTCAHGRGEATLRRDDQIELGGMLGYRTDHWEWRAYSR